MGMEISCNENKLWQLMNSEVISDPDMHYIFHKALCSAARKDDSVLREMLANLLLKRAMNNLDVDRLLLNESIETVSKLTKNQLDIITLSFLVYDYINTITVKTRKDLDNYFLTYASPFFNVDISEIDKRHIIYCGCASTENGLGTPSYSQILKNKYRFLFPELDTYKKNEQEYIDGQVKKHLVFGNNLIELTRVSYLWSLNLTSIGILIASIHVRI